MIGVKRLIFVLTVLVWLGALVNHSSAQRGLEVGAYGGGSIYFGDLNNSYDASHPGADFGAQFRYVFDDRLSVVSRLGYASVRGNDAWSDNVWERDRNLNFQSDIFDLTTEFEFNFFDYRHYQNGFDFTPYIGLGFTVLRFQPRASYEVMSTGGMTNVIEIDDLAALSTEGVDYSQIAGGVNLTLGLKYKIATRWTLQVFGTVRRLFTDYLDDVSTVYPNTTTNPSSPTIAQIATDPSLGMVYSSIPNSQRGDGRDFDAYHTFGAGLTFFFGDLICPKVQ